MLKRIIPIWTATILFVMILSTNIFACACCVEKGHYSISVTKPSDYDFAILRDLSLETATLYTDAAYPENIRGISPLNDEFSAEALLSGNFWNFSFKDDQGKIGKLNLRKPTSMVSYMVDLHENEDSEVSNVTVYKEWRFKYKVKAGTGIFSSGITKKTTYFLVLQGRGNGCTNAEDFSHWRLEVDGKKAKYAFFGKLKTD